MEKEDFTQNRFLDYSDIEKYIRENEKYNESLITENIWEAASVIGMDREGFLLAVRGAGLSADLSDQIMQRFDTNDTLPEDIQRSFAVLFRFSRTLRDPY